MAELEVPVYATNEQFQGPDACNAEQARAEMVSFPHWPLHLPPLTLSTHAQHPLAIASPPAVTS